MTCSASLLGDKDEPVGRQTFPVDVHLHRDERLDLETGEVFQDPHHFASGSRENETIAASLTIGRAVSDADYSQNVMHYSEPHESERSDSSPSQIYFWAFLPPDEFEEFVGRVRSNLLPSRVTVHLPFKPGESSPVEYGSSPDGGIKTWSNLDEKSRYVRIEKISFDYDLLKPKLDDATGQEPSVSEIAKTTSEIARTTSEIAKTIKRDVESLKKIGWLIVGITVAIAISHYFG